MLNGKPSLVDSWGMAWVGMDLGTSGEQTNNKAGLDGDQTETETKARGL